MTTEHRRMRILLVGNGRGSVEDLADRVRAMGYEVGVSRRVAALMGARILDPDVVVLDLDAGTAELLRGLHEQAGRRKPLVVALTETDAHATAGRAEACGPHLVLSKPICPAAIAGAFRRLQQFLAGIGALDPAA
ncbi:MAG: response regulator [Planctomycetes bacterium]|nr:response regulator [Planctomycetota bacterium]